jgi:RNA-binding protein Musashi
MEVRETFIRHLVSLDHSRSVDIYGDDENEYAVPLQEHENEVDEMPPTSDNGAADARPMSTLKKDHYSPQSSPTVRKDALRSLPAKPLSPSSAALSYSAQIAQQFSAYQQTPSQERQQRIEIPLPPHPRTTTTATSAIATHENSSGTGASDSIFGKKPSEMHDAG